jgi:hydrogenase nickel incorporation protein HypA/HybF
MHELSIALSLVELAADELARLGDVRLHAVHVRVGTLSGVVADALRFSFDVAADGTTVAGATLEIEEVPESRELQLRGLEVFDREPANRGSP